MRIEDLLYKKKSGWENIKERQKKDIYEFAKRYKIFLNNCKTEIEAVSFTENILKSKGFKKINEADKLVYQVLKSKSMAFGVLGEEPLINGVNIIATHIDSPRVDIKQNPMYQSNDICMLKTHYYGGIKKYQWLSTPLALHGVVIKNNGQKIKICIGEEQSDPVFVIPDLLPHLARKVQYTKKLGEAFDGNKMDVVFSSIPYLDKNDKNLKNSFKLNALYLLNQKYGIKEEDFLSAELCLVPAGKARDAGFDSSMVLGYGQDDRVCSFCGLEAILARMDKKPKKTVICYFADKEEVGSNGNTGAKSTFLKNFLRDLLKLEGKDFSSYALSKMLMNTQILSGDVSAAVNPNYTEVHDIQNATIMGSGVELSKFGGGGGKFSTNDANGEFVAKLIRAFKKDDILWQMSSHGKVDEGSGGTIAKYLANMGPEVIDCGVGIMGMHSLYELCSKADLYNTYKAYQSFLCRC